MVKRKFTRNSDDVKLNPNSLRKLLHDIVFDIHKDYEKASRQLSKNVSRYKKDHITSRAIQNIVEDKTYMHYWHLEAFSESLGIPSGVLLLFSRLRSNIDENEGDLNNARGKNQAIIDGISLIINNYDPDEPLTVKTLEKWAALYRESSGHQIRLPLSGPKKEKKVPNPKEGEED